MNYTVHVTKTKALISFADQTVKLICAYVLAYAKSRFSHAAQLSINLLTNLLQCFSFNAHKLGKNMVIKVILSEV